jgi:glycosyltransferase involved in cell wall biosynthesis
VQGGNYVEWFSASYPGALEEEMLQGVRIIRAGRQWTVHWAAFRNYRGKVLGAFDIVVDEVNTIPFFTPLWANVPTVMLIHQLARVVWWYEAPFPLNVAGFVCEPLYLRLYRHVPVLTVSASTKNDLSRLNFAGPITVVPEGLEPIFDQTVAKSTEPQFIYVGRLAPSKRIEHIFRALAGFRHSTGQGTLRLVGSGSSTYQQTLVTLSRRLGIAENVLFLGRVSSSEKHRLMAEAHAILMTSVREGWGLVVTEANACGTPAIVYDVPGLRDAVRNEATGLVVRPDPDSLSDAMVRLTSDLGLYARLTDESKLWSRTFTFDAATQSVVNALTTRLSVRRSATGSAPK